jgi:endonuclease/exonuclease/phosphatase family metal-dependent hydrolase
LAQSKATGGQHDQIPSRGLGRLTGALKGQLDDLQSLLPEYSWCGVGREDGRSRGEFSAIFYRKDRFDLLRSSTFWLSETPDVAGSKGWDAALPRIVTWAKFKDKQSSGEFFHFNTHFDHRGEQARQESARLLLSRIETITAGSRAVVTGDFNANESSEPYRIMAGGGSQGVRPKRHFKDARYSSEQAHHGPSSSFNGFKALVPGQKIDHIFVGEGTKVLQHGILSDSWDGRWPSDHLPVLAEIDLFSKR